MARTKRCSMTTFVYRGSSCRHSAVRMNIGHHTTMFQSLVHNNAKLSNIRKFHYLVSSVEIKAAEMLGAIEILDDQYDNT